jgi:ABC-type sugar transport systems, ATPase components
MAKITLKDLSHSYLEKQNNDSDWALRDINIDWKDGGAYALLGPSGCGKTTLLNIVSGFKSQQKEMYYLMTRKGHDLTPVEREYCSKYFSYQY